MRILPAGCAVCDGAVRRMRARYSPLRRHRLPLRRSPIRKRRRSISRWRCTSVGSPKISPDGKRVVYEQTRTNWDANAFETDLWIADVATGERHQLTTTGHSCNPAEWSPDGKWIAFLSDRPGALPKSPEDKRQLWIMPADGGEAQQLTKMETGRGRL